MNLQSMLDTVEVKETQNKLIIHGVIAVVIALVLIVGFNKFRGNGEVVAEVEGYTVGQRLEYQVDLTTQKFTVLHVENGNALVVDGEGDVWGINGEFHPDNVEETNLTCSPHAVTLALTIPASVLGNCTEKPMSNSDAFKMGIPTCNGTLYVSQTSDRVVGYECR